MLSRAKRYGKVNRKPSWLWEIVQGYLDSEGIGPCNWPPTAIAPYLAASAETDTLASGKIRLTTAQIERYLACPRQYYYRYVLGLSEQEEESGYKRFHDCVRETGSWLREQSNQGTVPTLWEEVVTNFNANWIAHGPNGHVHEEYYMAQAEEMIRRVWNELKSEPPQAMWHKEVMVELDDCQVLVRFDHSEIHDSGIQLIRYRTGRARDDHRKEARLALYREAARQQAKEASATIELRYLSDGSRVTVADQDRHERNRLAKLNDAAQRIAQREFSATPSEPSLCAGCRYKLICPV